jgi:hypothetical protein
MDQRCIGKRMNPMLKTKDRGPVPRIWHPNPTELLKKILIPSVPACVNGIRRARCIIFTESRRHNVINLTVTYRLIDLAPTVTTITPAALQHARHEHQNCYSVCLRETTAARRLANPRTRRGEYNVHDHFSLGTPLDLDSNVLF